TCVSSFGESGPDDRNFVLDAVAGEIAFGPAIREADGSLHRYGAVPPKGAAVRIPLYRSGGGRRGNVARGAISVLKSSIPYVTRVENRRPATGGVDVEDVEAAKVRGPILLRTRNRAVTAEDYEQLAREAAPDVARVRCVPVGRRARRRGMALGPARPRRRGLLGAPAPPGHRVRGGRPALPRRSLHRQAGRDGAPARHRTERPGVLLRTPGDGRGVLMRGPI